MPAFSHCFLKRFMAFSNDSPSLTRTPGILGITALRGVHEYPQFFEDAGVYAGSGCCQREQRVETPLSASTIRWTRRTWYARRNDCSSSPHRTDKSWQTRTNPALDTPCAASLPSSARIHPQTTDAPRIALG